jgi:hypothetical protein
MTRWLVTAALGIPGVSLLVAHTVALAVGLPEHTAALTGMPADSADPVLGALALFLGLVAPVLGPPLCAAALLHAVWPRRAISAAG